MASPTLSSGRRLLCAGTAVTPPPWAARVPQGSASFPPLPPQSSFPHPNTIALPPPSPSPRQTPPRGSLDQAPLELLFKDGLWQELAYQKRVFGPVWGRQPLW